MEQRYLELIEKLKLINNGNWYLKLDAEKDLSPQETDLAKEIKRMRDFVQCERNGEITQPIMNSFDAALRKALRIVEEFEKDGETQ